MKKPTQKTYNDLIAKAEKYRMLYKATLRKARQVDKKINR